MEKPKMKSSILRMTGRHLLNHLLFAFISLFLIISVSAMFTPVADAVTNPLDFDYKPAPMAVILPGFLAWVLFAVATYSEGWRVGARDLNLVKHNHVADIPFKGLVGCLLAQIPGLLTAAAAFVQVTLQWRREIPAALGWIVLGNRLFYAPYLWLFTMMDADVRPAILFLPALIQPLLAQWGYHNGFRYFSLFYSIVYRDPHRDKQSGGRDRRKRGRGV